MNKIQLLEEFPSTYIYCSENDVNIRVDFPQKHLICFDLGDIEQENLKFRLEGKLYCPIKARRNPQIDLLQAGSVEWVNRMGLNRSQNEAGEWVVDQKKQKRVNRHKFWLSVAHCHPDDRDDQLLLLSKWINFLYFYDDDMDKHKEICMSSKFLEKRNNDIIAVLRGISRNVEKEPLLKASQDIKDDIEQYDLSALFTTLINSLELSFQAALIELKNKHTKSVLPEETYKILRDQAGGVIPTIILGCITRRCDFNSLYKKDVLIRSVLTIANRCICHSNDVLSLGSELREGTTSNLVIVKACQDNWTIEQALKFSIMQHNREMYNYLFLRDKILKEHKGKKTTEQCQLFFDICDAWIAGILQWSLATLRFQVSAVCEK